MVRLSKRAERKLFAGYLPIDLARNPAMAARRKARRARKNSVLGYKLPNQRRAFRARNVLGRMIWANKPRRFGGAYSNQAGQ